jgi:hypothetical protein
MTIFRTSDVNLGHLGADFRGGGHIPYNIFFKYLGALKLCRYFYRKYRLHQLHIHKPYSEARTTPANFVLLPSSSTYLAL